MLLDAYGTHKNFEAKNENYFKQKNIFFLIIPACLTGLLQPLDVAVNRSFQQNLAHQYDAYLVETIADEKNRTKAGNIRIPDKKSVSQWVLNWTDSSSCEFIANSFVVCGFVHPDEFSVADLHEPLRECFSDDFEEEKWLEKYGNLLSDHRWDFSGAKQWSLHRALFDQLECDQGFISWRECLVDGILELVTSDGDMSALFEKQEEEAILSGILTTSKIDIAAAADFLGVSIKIFEVDGDNDVLEETKYGSSSKIINVGCKGVICSKENFENEEE